jgi:hypothetical protein
MPSRTARASVEKIRLTCASFWHNQCRREHRGDRTRQSRAAGRAVTNIAIYRPSEGAWYILKSSSGFTAWTFILFGAPTDVPVPQDYDGDGISDVAVYRPSTGSWFVLKSSTNFTTYTTMQWGTAADVPILRRP